MKEHLTFYRNLERKNDFSFSDRDWKLRHAKSFFLVFFLILLQKPTKTFLF